MPVPVFVWSAGDIVVSIKILIHVGEALRESGGAKDQFAETSTWLDSFAHDLEKVREFVINSRDAKYTENLVQQIAIIDPQYKKFEDHIQKFDPSLSSNSSISFIKRSGRTLQWAVKELKGHVDGLKNSVSGPLTSINLLLNLQNLSVPLLSWLRPQISLLEDKGFKILQIMCRGLEKHRTLRISN